MTNVLKWFATWLLFIVGAAALARTDWGRPIVYGLLWLLVALLVLSHADEITSLIDIQALNLNG